MEKTITAIDLGTTKIVCITGQKTPAGIHILSSLETPSLGIKRGEIVNNQTVLNSLIPLIQSSSEQVGQPINEVIVGIAGQYIRCQAECTIINRPNDTEEITAAEIKALSDNMRTSRVNPGEEILHVIPQSYHVDDHMGITEPVGMLGKRMEANYRLFVGKTTSAEHTKRCIQSAGLHLNRLVLEPLASAEATIKEDEKELGVAMVDIGGGTTDLLIYHGNVIRHAAVIPCGGNIISEDIRTGCEVTLRQAEQMKIQYGSCYADLSPNDKTIVVPGIGGRESREISFRTLAHIIEARMDEIMEAVMYEIENSGYKNKLPAGIVLTGGGSLLNHLPQYIKYKTGYDTRIARPAFLDADAPSEVNSVAYSCAVGLLMKGFEYEENASKLEYERQPIQIEEPTVAVESHIEAKSRKGRKGKGEWSLGNLFSSVEGFFTENDNNV